MWLSPLKSKGVTDSVVSVTPLEVCVEGDLQYVAVIGNHMGCLVPEVELGPPPCVGLHLPAPVFISN